MKLKSIFLTILLTACPLDYAMMAPLCKMPSADTLNKCLDGHKGLVTHTNIIDDLANKELSALQVVTVVERAVDDYIKILNLEQKNNFTSNSMVQMVIRMLPERKSTIVALLLKEYPDEYASVKHLLVKKTAKL